MSHTGSSQLVLGGCRVDRTPWIPALGKLSTSQGIPTFKSLGNAHAVFNFIDIKKLGD